MKTFKIVQHKHDNTRIEKGFNGWSGETFTEVNGQTYCIRTSKRYSGNITATSQPCEIMKGGGAMFHDMSNLYGKNLTLLREDKRATEKTIRELHAKALLIFDEKIKDIEPIKEEKPEIGTVLFMDGYGKTKGSHGNRHIIYNIRETNFGIKYDTVEPDTLVLDSKDYVKNFKDKFGIGIYFEPEYKYTGSQNDLNNLVLDARKQREEDQKKEEASKLMKAQIRAGKIEEGKKLVSIPTWAKTVIVADNYQNDSDSMTDYFSTSVESTFYLAYSRTSRNNMKELREAALNFEETKDFPSLADENKNGKYNEVNEHTTGHSYLPDYFLGTENWYGLKVNKRKYFDLTNEEHRNKLYIAAAEGRYLIPNEESKQTTKRTETAVSPDGLTLIDYSVKAFAIIGDTKPHKDTLKSLGGRFNFRLRCGAGWIFPKTKEEEVKKAFNL